MNNESKRRGRPPADIDLAQVEKLGQLNPTNREVAAYFGVSERTIESRIQKDEDFRTALNRGAANVDLSLRRKQIDMALNGDKTMLIWLGKQRLGQQDKVATEHSGRVDGPPPKIHVNFVTPQAAEE